MIFFTGDTHFGHSNILKYANRSYRNVVEMNEDFIAKFNSKVTEHDTVYHLGDFAFLPVEEATKILRRLNGQVHLIYGNHDGKFRSEYRKVFASTSDIKQIKVGNKDIVMCHYAMRVWNKSHYGAIQLYGHSHGTLPEDENLLSTDVGVDNCNYYPISFNEVMERMKTRKFVPIDHHRGKDV